MVLDGSEQADENIKSMLTWDVFNGVARRSWSGNENAVETITHAMSETSGLIVTLPNHLEDDSILNGL